MGDPVIVQGWTNTEVIALVAVLATLIGGVLAITGWLLNRNSNAVSKLHDKIEGLKDTMPESFVPRKELNGRLVQLNASVDDLHEDHKSLQGTVNEILRTVARIPTSAQQQGDD